MIINRECWNFNVLPKISKNKFFTNEFVIFFTKSVKNFTEKACPKAKWEWLSTKNVEISTFSQNEIVVNLTTMKTFSGHASKVYFLTIQYFQRFQPYSTC